MELSLLEKILINLEEGYKAEMITDEEIVQLLNHGSDLLNLRSISDIQKETDLTYNGVLKSPKHKIVEVANKKFVIDND